MKTRNIKQNVPQMKFTILKFDIKIFLFSKVVCILKCDKDTDRFKTNV